MNKSDNQVSTIAGSRFRRILFVLGYWTPYPVPLCDVSMHTHGSRRSLVSDIDVFGLRYDEFFSPSVIVADCTHRTSMPALDRLFWLRGVMEYLNADQAFFIRGKLGTSEKRLASKLNLNLLCEEDLVRLEKSVGAQSLDMDDSDAWIGKHLQSMLDEHRKDKVQDGLIRLVRYLLYSYWSVEFHRNLFYLIEQFESASCEWDVQDSSHRLIGYLGLERFAHCILDLASQVNAQGGSDIAHCARMYLHGGLASLYDKQRFFELLQRFTGTQEELDPIWFEQILELVICVMRNPRGASDVLRHVTAIYYFCERRKQTELPSLYPGSQNHVSLPTPVDPKLTNERDELIASWMTRVASVTPPKELILPGLQSSPEQDDKSQTASEVPLRSDAHDASARMNTDAIVLAKRFADLFAKISRIPLEIFDAMKPL